MDNSVKSCVIKTGLIIKLVIAGYFLATVTFLSFGSIASGNQNNTSYLDTRYDIFVSGNLAGSSSPLQAVSGIKDFNY